MIRGLIIIATLTAVAAGADSRRVEQVHDFSSDDPFTPWVNNTTWTEHFRGITDEQTFKLDVTFENSGYAYWAIPVSLPAASELKLAGRIRIEATGGTTVGLGINVQLPPTVDTGCKPFKTFGKGGQWHDLDGDVVAMGRTIANIVVAPNVWGLTGEQASARIDRVVLFVYARKGDHVVIELDDVRLTGRVPTDESFERTVQEQRVQYQQRVNRQLDQWRSALSRVHGQLKGLGARAATLRDKAHELQDRLEQISKRGAMQLTEHADFVTWLPALDRSVRGLAATADADPRVTMYVTDPISRIKILPDSKFIPGTITDTIDVTAAPGEFEPASIVVVASQSLPQVTVESEIRGAEADVHIVKCWYQAGTAWGGIAQDKSKRVLVPELLLKDDALVRVDHEAQRNELKLGDRYVDISNADEPNSESFNRLSVKDYPVRDAKTLQPVDIAEGTNRQYWLTIKAPPASGDCVGTVVVKSNGKKLATLNLNLRVLPFTLVEPRVRHNLDEPFISSIYYRSILVGDTPQGTISSEARSVEQIRAELQDMVDHGITNPTCYQPWKLPVQFNQYTGLREQAGIRNKPLLLLNLRPGDDPEQLAKIAELLAWTRKRKIPQLYLYGIDEAKGDRLAAQRQAWIATRKLGVKMFVAGYRGSNFPKLGDIQDVLVCAGALSTEEADLWHSVGHRIWSYANPQSGPENPAVFRRNFGLALWLANYDGACTYAYMHSFGNIWNDFDNHGYRDPCLVYPTVDGVIDTLAIEGYREGIDDIRYVTTLALKVRGAKDGSAKAAARRFLDQLSADGNLDQKREAIIEHILQLQ